MYFKFDHVLLQVHTCFPTARRFTAFSYWPFSTKKCAHFCTTAGSDVASRFSAIYWRALVCWVLQQHTVATSLHCKLNVKVLTLNKHLSRTLLVHSTGQGSDHFRGISVNARITWQWTVLMIYVTLWNLRSDTPVMQCDAQNAKHHIQMTAI